MSKLQRLLVLLCPVILFLMGLANIVYEYGPKTLRHWLDVQLTAFPQLAITCWWTLLMVTPLCMFLLWVDRIFHSSLLVLKSDSGQPLKIREVAVRRYLHDRLLSLPYIRKAQVRAFSRSGGALALKVRVWVACRKPLDNIQERVLDHLVDNARRGFGVSRVLPPELHFESVRVSKKEQPEADEPESLPGFLPPPSSETLKRPDETASPSPEERSNV